jgi:hypothetical protein
LDSRESSDISEAAAGEAEADVRAFEDMRALLSRRKRDE